MKSSSEEIIQFSGYPLKVVEDKISQLHVIFTKQHQFSYSPLQVKPIADDPTKWDAEWFGNYE
ncbi:MAG: hypothetical protein ACM3VS_01760 [Candidatus Dadabacteria bacterium]